MRIDFSLSYFDFEEYVLITTLALNIHNLEEETKIHDLKGKKRTYDFQ